jgi:FMN phosphatase YigB (HAD superfamily)
MTGIRYLLWDFGDTLVDQRWMWPSPEHIPGWTARFEALIDTELDERWLRGDTTTEEVAAIFASDLGTTTEVLIAHIERLCADVHFYEHAWAAARARQLPQAIVTLNPDLFSDLIVPNYALDSVFDEIVTSWQERTLDKARLCAIALERLGGHDPGDALLIDNVDENVEAWRSLGGRAYLFRGDHEFHNDGLLAENAQ